MRPWLAAVLLLFAILVGLAYMQASGREPSAEGVSPAGSAGLPSEEGVLSDADLIELFESLDARRLELYRQPTSSDTSEVFLEGSEIHDRVSAELRQLSDDSISARPRIRTTSLSVMSKTPHEAILTQTVVSSARFFDEVGQDVTQDPVRERRVIEWTLSRTEAGWRFADAVITFAESAAS